MGHLTNLPAVIVGRSETLIAELEAVGVRNGPRTCSRQTTVHDKVKIVSTVFSAEPSSRAKRTLLVVGKTLVVLLPQQQQRFFYSAG